MDNELTWEQEQDIQDYEQYLAEEAAQRRFQARIDAAIAEQERIWEAEQEAMLDEPEIVDPATAPFGPRPACQVEESGDIHFA